MQITEENIDVKGNRVYFHSGSYVIKSLDTLCYEFYDKKDNLISAITFMASETEVDDWIYQCEIIDSSINN